MSLAADALGDRAGADVMDLKNHSPIWIVCEVPRELMKELLPCLVESKKCIDEKYEEKNGKKQNLLDCLKLAQVFLLAIDYLIRRFIQMSASCVKVDEDGVVSLHNFPAFKHHEHPEFSHSLLRSEMHCEFSVNVQVVEQEHASRLESMSIKENAADNVVTSSNVIKALTCQFLQVVKNNSIKLKVIMSKECNSTNENSNEDMNDPSATSSRGSAPSRKITATRAEIVDNEIRNGNTTLVHMSTGLFTAEELWDEWYNGTNGNPLLKELAKTHGCK